MVSASVGITEFDCAGLAKNNLPTGSLFSLERQNTSCFRLRQLRAREVAKRLAFEHDGDPQTVAQRICSESIGLQ